MININPRTSAYQGEYVRLYCPFNYDGIPSDPDPPVVYIANSSDLVDQSSSSGDGTGVFGPFEATKEYTGLWYVDWLVPDDLAVGDWYDLWSYTWMDSDEQKQDVFAFTVQSADTWVRYAAPPGVERISGTMAEMIRVLNNIALDRAQNIPIEAEQGKRNADRKKITFAFENWNQYPRPEVIKNRRLIDTGWHTDYNGTLIFNRNLDPEDVVYCSYHFRYFSDLELADMLNYGLYMMNAVPPVSENYPSVSNAPFSWRAPIIAAAAMTALQRLIMGLTWQHRKIIFGEDPQVVDAAMAKFQSDYEMFKNHWEAGSKGVKTMKWPGMAQIVQPEFTLPGGRSRWFRFLFKG